MRVFRTEKAAEILCADPQVFQNRTEVFNILVTQNFTDSLGNIRDLITEILDGESEFSEHGTFIGNDGDFPFMLF